MEASKLRKEKGWTTINDSGRGYRRVVPSPNPTVIVESVSIKELYDHGVIVIACGGGGIPLITNDDNTTLQGVEAVIDKDHAAALFATVISVDILLILTDVDKVALHYGRPNQKELDAITIEDAKKYLAEGHFPAGSMGPKIESAIHFVESGGEKAIITSIESATSSLRGSGGTTIHS